MILPSPLESQSVLSYIDLGTGSLIAQVLIASGIGGLVFYRKMIWKKIKRVALFWRRNRK